jgi:hypothetical protein
VHWITWILLAVPWHFLQVWWFATFPHSQRLMSILELRLVITSAWKQARIFTFVSNVILEPTLFIPLLLASSSHTMISLLSFRDSWERLLFIMWIAFSLLNLSAREAVIVLFLFLSQYVRAGVLSSAELSLWKNWYCSIVFLNLLDSRHVSICRASIDVFSGAEKIVLSAVHWTLSKRLINFSFINSSCRPYSKVGLMKALYSRTLACVVNPVPCIPREPIVARFLVSRGFQEALSLKGFLLRNTILQYQFFQRLNSAEEMTPARIFWLRNSNSTNAVSLAAYWHSWTLACWGVV